MRQTGELNSLLSTPVARKLATFKQYLEGFPKVNGGVLE
jgi:hypothetical protein